MFDHGIIDYHNVKNNCESSICINRCVPNMLSVFVIDNTKYASLKNYQRKSFTNLVNEYKTWLH